MYLALPVQKKPKYDDTNVCSKKKPYEQAMFPLFVLRLEK
jgi:hypothetical protein